jgi:hypothetical protein
VSFDPNSLIRPGERRASKRKAQKAQAHPLVLTRGEFGQGLHRSGQTAGQNFRAAARKRMSQGPNAMHGAELQAAVQSAVKGRRYQRKQINQSNLSPALRALAKRRLQAHDVNQLRAGTGSAPIRVRTRAEVMKRRRAAQH